MTKVQNKPLKTEDFPQKARLGMQGVIKVANGETEVWQWVALHKERALGEWLCEGGGMELCF